jgi:hypothetical protein
VYGPLDRYRFLDLSALPIAIDSENILEPKQDVETKKKSESVTRSKRGD